MSDFSPEWLDLRETADVRARSSDVADAVAARFALRDELRVLDLGSGTGANLRAIASLLPTRQTWKLVDHDPALLARAKGEAQGLGRYVGMQRRDLAYQKRRPRHQP